jgi:ABC-2 type transport system ATP-binding protein
MMASVLEIKGLAKHFKTIRAVDGLNLSLDQGTVFGFLGQNGAGKTTTLRMITGLARPTAGEVSICGHKVVFGSDRTNASIGYLPDAPQFYDWMKPAEYLVLCGMLMGLNRADAGKKAVELLSMVGLADAKRRIKGFSRGMKQRLGIAQALMHNPALLLMDEPTSALDPIGRKEVLDIIAALGGRHTVLFSTHILSDAERVCNRVGIQHKGRLALEGTLQELSARYPMEGALLEIASPAQHDALLQGLKGMPWLKEVQPVSPGSFIIKTSSPDRMDAELCPMLAALGIPIRRFEHLEPTLEDVFMEVIGQ